MTFIKIWIDFCVKKPKLNNPESVIEIKTSEFKKLLEQVYNKGFQEGNKVSESSSFDDLLKNYFKNK